MSHTHHEDPILVDSTEIAKDIRVKENEENEEVVKDIIGVVTDCLKLNIRKEPNKDSDVVVIVTCLDELKIDPDASTDDWYAVCTVTGIEGFCMKKFVAVRQ